jgi:hypothetical protein
MGDRPIARPLPGADNTNTEKKRTYEYVRASSEAGIHEPFF